MPAPEYNLSVKDVALQLGRRKKAVYEYVRRQWLHPQIVESEKSTTKFLFSQADVDAFKTISQETLMRSEALRSVALRSVAERSVPEQDEELNDALNGSEQGDEAMRSVPLRSEAKRSEAFPEETVRILQEHVGFLREQIMVKDGQIKDLSERNKESNILLHRMQERLQLEKPKDDLPAN